MTVVGLLELTNQLPSQVSASFGVKVLLLLNRALTVNRSVKTVGQHCLYNHETDKRQ